jgi:Ser/Thr protein kinase RdoA (MazF antagonist)
MDNYGLIHTEFHFGNMYYYNNQLTFFDFDDASYKYFISDIAIVLYYYFMFQDRESKREEKVVKILSPLLKGYETENHIAFEEFSNLNDYMKLRETILYLVVKAHSYKETNPNTQTFLSKLKENIEHEIPFFQDLSFLKQLNM